MVYLVGIAAALSLGIGYVLQQRVAATEDLSRMLHFRMLLDLMHRPLWWLGIACMIAGQLLGGLALQLATVAVVEPLLSTGLLFALGFAAFRSGQRIRWHELCGAVLLSAALGVFIAVGNPHSSHSPDTNDAVVVAAVGAVALTALVLTLIGRRRSLVVESVLLATGAGLLFGLQDAGTRAALVAIDHDGLRLALLNPWPYIVLVAGVFGILLSQSAFKAARLDYSLPPIAAAEPVAGIALGLGLLGDVVSVSVAGLAVESVCLVAMVAGVILIGRSPSLAGACQVPSAETALSPARAERADSP